MIQPPAVPTISAQTVPGLRRELGRWDLTAVGVNQVIGGGIFALAAGLAARVNHIIHPTSNAGNRPKAARV